jgi:hypothetical protein
MVILKTTLFFEGYEGDTRVTFSITHLSDVAVKIIIRF